MRDQEQDQEYPRHQPGRGMHNHHDPFEPLVQEEGELEDVPRHSPVHQHEVATTPQLPRHHARKALIAGVVLGLLVSLQGVLLIYKNADVYTAAKQYTTTGTMPVSLASTLVGIYFLGVGISMLIYLLGGLIIGRIAVHRRWAFIGGFVGGIVSSVIGALLKLLPNYPNASNTGMSGNMLGMGGGLIALLIGTIVLGVLAGLVCLLGAWLMTRRHPYYVGYYG